MVIKRIILPKKPEVYYRKNQNHNIIILQIIIINM